MSEVELLRGVPVGSRVRAARDLRALGQAAVVARMSSPLTKGSLSLIESGKIRPTGRTVRALSVALDVPLGFFYSPSPVGWDGDRAAPIFFRDRRATPSVQGRRKRGWVGHKGIMYYDYGTEAFHGICAQYVWLTNSGRGTVPGGHIVYKAKISDYRLPGASFRAPAGVARGDLIYLFWVKDQGYVSHEGVVTSVEPLRFAHHNGNWNQGKSGDTVEADSCT